jgi:hypothetical protein
MYSLISVDTTDHVKFFNTRGPIRREHIETWKARSLAQLGFPVEVHEEPYDPRAAHNRRVAGLASAPVAIESQAAVAAGEAVAPGAPEEEPKPGDAGAVQVGAKGEDPKVEPEDEAIQTKDEVPPPSSDVKGEDPKEGPGPGADEGEPKPGEDAAQEGQADDEGAAVDLDELRTRVDGLKSLKDALALIAELGVEASSAPTKLADAKEILVKAIEEAAAEEGAGA